MKIGRTRFKKWLMLAGVIIVAVSVWILVKRSSFEGRIPPEVVVQRAKQGVEIKTTGFGLGAPLEFSSTFFTVLKGGREMRGTPTPATFEAAPSKFYPYLFLRNQTSDTTLEWFDIEEVRIAQAVQQDGIVYWRINDRYFRTDSESTSKTILDWLDDGTKIETLETR